MTKYIKLEDIQKIFADENRPLNWTDTEAEAQEVWDFDFYKSQIESLPTIDIVYCKDCKRVEHTPVSSWKRPYICCIPSKGLGYCPDDGNGFCPYGV